MARQRVGGGGADEVNTSTEYIAQLFGMTPRRVRQLVADGDIPATKQGSTYVFDPLEAAREYIRFLSDRRSGRVSEATGKFEGQILEFDANYKCTKARIAEIELSELEGRLHRSEDVEAMIAELALMIRNALMAMPGRLAVDMAEIASPAEASERLRQEVTGILDELANYEYCPSTYGRRSKGASRPGRKLLLDKNSYKE